MSEKVESEHAAGGPVGGLEAELARTLQPVKPSGVFVRALRQRIHVAPRAVVIEPPRDYNAVLLAAGGVVTALVVILTAVRALYFLFGRGRT